MEGRTPTRRSTRPALVLALECARPLAGSVRFDLSGVDSVDVGRGKARSHVRVQADGGRRLRIEVPDDALAGGVRLSKAAGRWGVQDGRASTARELGDGDVLEAGGTFFLFKEVDAAPDGSLDAEASPGEGRATLCRALEEQWERLKVVAKTDVPVLILGETGTGKELAARAVHRLSGRPGPFVPVNCGALPAALVESELGGSRKGAFTGAQEDREGLVRAAHRGTLFLDELGDLPLSAQPAFLRILQEREVWPVGGTRGVPVDFRLVSATLHDLTSQVASNGFREDLLSRVAGFTLRLPMLRDRLEDLGLLVGAVLGRGGAAPALTVEAARALFAYGWPRNIRELEQCLQVARALSGEGAIALEHLPEAVRAPSCATQEARDRLEAAGEPSPDLREGLVALLRAHRGNVSAVAREMGKARMQIQRWLKRFGLDPADFH